MGESMVIKKRTITRIIYLLVYYLINSVKSVWINENNQEPQAWYPLLVAK